MVRVRVVVGVDIGVKVTGPSPLTASWMWVQVVELSPGLVGYLLVSVH